MRFFSDTWSVGFDLFEKHCNFLRRKSRFHTSFLMEGRQGLSVISDHASFATSHAKNRLRYPTIFKETESTAVKIRLFLPWCNSGKIVGNLWRNKSIKWLFLTGGGRGVIANEISIIITPITYISDITNLHVFIVQ